MMTEEIDRLRKELGDLRHQYGNRTDLIREKQRQLIAAQIEKMDADYAGQGIKPGCKVMAVNTTWREVERRSGPYIYLGVGPAEWKDGANAQIYKIKKDGTASKFRAHEIFDRLELAADQ